MRKPQSDTRASTNQLEHKALLTPSILTPNNGNTAVDFSAAHRRADYARSISMVL